MTGEMFAVLYRHSVLKSDAPADDEVAFEGHDPRTPMQLFGGDLEVGKVVAALLQKLGHFRPLE